MCGSSVVGDRRRRYVVVVVVMGARKTIARNPTVAASLV